ncbi:acyltransferase domain-containing protein [Paenibacillus dokdonensis]|uniref:acyltransferase domain-containing protein n=1 Tax=Paenibacillus dokdonensis TaxID=2567944 RepID=UPI0010A7B537|nr:acyltransferase domain-containing protein [Paenibacillus dokdonensis]
MDRRLSFNECITICNFDYLPEGLEDKYNQYDPNNKPHLIPRDFLSELFVQYEIPEHTRQRLIRGIEAIETDDVLFHFTKFLVEVLCSARNRCDETHYTHMTPGCMNQDGDLYSFLLLLACVVPSMEMLQKRSVPEAYYEQIPHQPLKHQLEKLVLNGDSKVDDFPWVMNFYTCSIFLLDRFYFIPYRFGDPFTMFRHVNTHEVIALRHAGEEFRSDGQRSGINDVYDPQGCFTSEWLENGDSIIANRMNPMGFVERDKATILKKEWEPVLQDGDMLLALHIPAGPGYTPDRLKNSMSMAIEFYGKYFPELPIKGFWSASWLYDTRLSLLLDNEKSNIVRVQRQFYNYPTLEGDGMLRYELFGDRKADPLAGPGAYTTSLQKAAAAYMQTGARFNTLSMIVLKEEIEQIGSMPYITDTDIEQFRRTVDSHLREENG